jgi:cytochrome c-type biogenesis protein CcmF
VHAFAQSPVGNWFLGFLILATALSAYLVSTRLQDMQAKAELESMVSREAAFLYNNLVLVGICFATLWGTLFPILSEAVKGEKLNVGPPFFNAVNGPLGLLLLALTGIGPLIAWRRASVSNLRRQFTFPMLCGVTVFVVLLALGMRSTWALLSYLLSGFVLGTIGQEFYKGIGARHRMYSEGIFTASMRLIARNRRRYGGYIVHFGVVVLFCAFAGLPFKKEVTADVKTGEVIKATDAYGHQWTFTSQGVSRFEQLNRRVLAVSFNVTRDGKPKGILSSEKRQHVNSRGEPTFEPSTEVGIIEAPSQDVYMVFTGAADEDTARVHITFNPLVWWVWFGGIMMAFGGLVVMWPQADKRERQSGYAAVMPSSTQPELVEAGVR